MTDEQYWRLGVLFLLFLLSAFFSGSETALTAIDRLRVHYLVDQKRRGARRLEELLAQPDRLLSGILIGNNLVNIAASVFATTLFVSWFGSQHGELATILILTPLLLLFAEVCPKVYAKRNPERVAFFALRPIQAVLWLLGPLVALVTFFSRFMTRLMPHEADRPIISGEEIRAMINVGEKEGVVAEEQHRMLHGIFELAEICVRDVMIPRTEVIGIEAGSSFEQVLKVVQESKHSRFPVFEGDLDHVVGVIHSKEILDYIHRPQEFSLKNLARRPFFVPESTPIEALLHAFRKRRAHLAMVVDEYGGVEGIVTLEDVVEEIVGEIQDEYDEEEVLIRPLGPGSYLIDASASVRMINRRFSLDLSEQHVTTMAGFVLRTLGRIPQEGEVCRVDGVELVVRRMEQQRIEELEMRLLTRDHTPSG